MEKDKNKVELRVWKITSADGTTELGTPAEERLLVLGEKDGFRSLSIIIGVHEARLLVMELNRTAPPRPLMHHLFAMVLEALNATLLRALIYKVEEGVYFSYIYLKIGEGIIRVDARTSDALLLCLLMKAPIYAYEELMLETSEDTKLPDNSNNAPVGATLEPAADEFFLNDRMDLLDEALKKAIEEEDFEKAAQIQKEIQRRQTE
jgi:bifunctional DNase/RNase